MGGVKIYRRLVIVVIACCGFWGALFLNHMAAFSQPLSARSALGVNLAGPKDWNTELPFVDAFSMSRPWISQSRSAQWGKGPPLSLDAHGWVTKLKPGCWAETFLCSIKGNHYPAGNYTVLYEGTGKLEFKRAAAIVSSKPGHIIIRVDPSKGAIVLKLTATDPENYVRNIHVIMPGFEKTYLENPFHPDFLNRWHGVACFRFMDWMKTNGSEMVHWSDRPQPGDATFSEKGVPLERMIDLCNRVKANPWFCMPHLADDDFVRNFARMVKDRLDSNLQVYLEYSNEVWNTRFAQYQFAAAEGQKRGFSTDPRLAACRFTAFRSVEIFNIWEDVFRDKKRIIRILPAQAANVKIADNLLSFKEAWQHADALAIAPYLSFLVTKKGARGSLAEAQVQQWTIQQALDYLKTTVLKKAEKRMKKHKEIAEKYGLMLIAYEGGQHMVGIRAAARNEQINQLIHEANAHDQMGNIYGRYLDAWAQAGGGLFCHFSSVAKWTNWGCWGLMQYYDDDPIKSPKFMAVMQWARDCGQNVRVPAVSR